MAIIRRKRWQTWALVMATAISSLANAAGPMCAAPLSRAPSSVVESLPANGISVIQLDPTLPTDELKTQGYDVKTIEQFNAADPWQDPDPVLRDRLLKAAGLNAFLHGADQLTRDMLFLRAQEQPLESLRRKYPRIPGARLKLLQKWIAQEKGAHP